MSSFISNELGNLITYSESLIHMPQDEMEASAKIFFEQLTSLYQISLLIEAMNSTNKTWIEPALNYLTEHYNSPGLKANKPLSVNEVKGLIAWDF